jgi:hypothetical protein
MNPEAVALIEFANSIQTGCQTSATVVNVSHTNDTDRPPAGNGIVLQPYIRFAS